MKRRLIALVAILALIGAVNGSMAHTTYARGHESSCEGYLGFDHGLKSDGGGWYHSMTRYMNTNLQYTVIKHHYYGYNATWHHNTVRNDCFHASG